MQTDNGTTTVSPQEGSGADDKAEIEVVQLKFLQKSNKEQMEKLFELFRMEPLVIHYYLQRTIFPGHTRNQKLKLSGTSPRTSFRLTCWRFRPKMGAAWHPDLSKLATKIFQVRIKN